MGKFFNILVRWFVDCICREEGLNQQFLKIIEVSWGLGSNMKPTRPTAFADFSFSFIIKDQRAGKW